MTTRPLFRRNPPSWSTFVSQSLLNTTMSAESSKKAQKRKSMADATLSTSVRLAESSSSVGPVFGKPAHDLTNVKSTFPLSGQMEIPRLRFTLVILDLPAI